MARLTVARKIATVTWIVWKKRVCFDALDVLVGFVSHFPGLFDDDSVDNCLPDLPRQDSLPGVWLPGRGLG